MSSRTIAYEKIALLTLTLIETLTLAGGNFPWGQSSRYRSINLFLTNKPLSFDYSTSVFTGLSDHDIMILTVFKTTFTKLKPSEIKYRDYKAFN